MDEDYKKYIITLYGMVIDKTRSNDHKKNISTLLYSNSVSEI